MLLFRCWPAHQLSRNLKFKLIVKSLNTAKLMMTGTALLSTAMLTIPALAIEVGEMRCENQREPLAIDALQPQLSWKLSSLQRGVKQTAYHVLVATSPALLVKNQADLWDSGKIESGQSTHVKYVGRVLQSRQACFWKVRVWNEKNGAAHWSRVAQWTMGVLHSQEWKGQWIGAQLQQNSSKDTSLAALYLRKEVVLDRKPERALIRFCGLGYHELYINGHKVGDAVLDPSFTDFTKRATYVTYDISHFLNKGRNTFGVILGNGWYRPTPDGFGYEKASWAMPPKLMLEVELNKGQQFISSDTSWKYSTGPITYNSVRGGETYDTRLELPGWNLNGFDDKAWSETTTVPGPSGKLVAQSIPSIKKVREIKAISLTEPRPGVFVYDLGEHIAGWARFTTTGPAGTTVHIDFDENLNDDGTIFKKSLTTHTVGRYQHGELILSGHGEEAFEPRFTYHGFRYIMVTGVTEKPTLDSLAAFEVHNDLATAGKFSCSNKLFNRIHAAHRSAMLNSSHSIYTEPGREKISWTEDAHNVLEGLIYNFDSATFANKWLDDILDSQEPNGHVPPINPSASWGRSRNNQPGEYSDPWWGGVIVEVPWLIYRYYGDRQALERSYEPMRRFVDYLGTTAKDEVFLDWYLGDWMEVGASAAMPERTPVIQTSTTAYFYYAKLLSKAATVLNKPEDAAKYAQLAQKIKLAFNTRFLDKTTGLYAKDSQTSQVLPLYTGLAPDELRPLILQRLVENIHEHKNHFTTGFVGYLYLFYGLTDMGYGDLVYDMATQKDYPGYAHMLELGGGNALCEAWFGNGAYNFASLGGIGQWFFMALAGIQPDPSGPGFKKITIRPEVVGDLTWAKASYDSVHGEIVSSWKRQGEQLTLDIVIPANTTATVFLPTQNAATVTENGISLTQAKNVKRLRLEENRIALAVGSGNYHFICQLPSTKR